jgi:hypothetical protein
MCFQVQCVSRRVNCDIPVPSLLPPPPYAPTKVLETLLILPIETTYPAYHPPWRGHSAPAWRGSPQVAPAHMDAWNDAGNVHVVQESSVDCTTRWQLCNPQLLVAPWPDTAVSTSLLSFLLLAYRNTGRVHSMSIACSLNALHTERIGRTPGCAFPCYSDYYPPVPTHALLPPLPSACSDR